MEDPVKHLEFIQAIIARQTGNSFLLKGWSITLVTTLFALASNATGGQFVLVALVPIIGFWGLDSYYLQQEKQFRVLFDDVRLGRLAVECGPFCLDPSRATRRISYWAALSSWAVCSFHLLLLIVCIGVRLWLARSGQAH